MNEQLIAAGMHAGDDGDRQPTIDRHGVVERQVRLEMQLAVSEFFLLRLDSRVYVADIGKPLGTQQRLADILRGKTDDRQFAEPDSGGLQRRLVRPPAPRRQDTGRPGQGRHV